MRPIPSHTNGIFPFPNFNLSPNFSASVLGGCDFGEIYASLYFLAVQNSSIGDLVTDSLTHCTFTIDKERGTHDLCDLCDI